jgi:hypothetical protein
VLKRNIVAFDPPLPPSKRAAIEALGFGTLNKCVMLFPKPFWDTSLDTFGRVAASTVARGEFFLFYSYCGLGGPNGVVLIGLVAGEAATAFEADDAQAGLQRCLATLRSIYSHRGIEVPEPVAWRCTAWAGDPFSFGSYSHVAVGASGDDYDAMMEPVGGRLFFAGEATTRKHPATMHGAFFTGLREAARITGSVVARRRTGAGEQVPDFAAASAAALALARDAAHLQAQLAATFAAPAWEFGSFAVAHAPYAHADAPSLLRVDVGGGGAKRALYVDLCLRLADALALRDCPGPPLPEPRDPKDADKESFATDADRLRLLLTLPGGALFGRRALPREAAALAAELAVARGIPRDRPKQPDEKPTEVLVGLAEAADRILQAAMLPEVVPAAEEACAF